MPSYVPPLRDLQFVLHELLDLENELKAMPKHAETDADTINAVLEEGGKFAAEVVFPLNVSGDEEGCKLDRDTHEVKAPTGFKDAYEKYVEGGWAALSAQEEKHLTAVADPLQVAFEIHGLILALHYEARFLRNPGAADRARKGFSEIVARNQV